MQQQGRRNLLLALLAVTALHLNLVARTQTGAAEPRPGREQLLFDNGWRFHLGDAASPEGDFGFDVRKVYDFPATWLAHFGGCAAKNWRHSRRR